MADTETKDRILDAMWRGDLEVRENPEENPTDASSEKDEATEMSEEDKRKRQREALEHLMSGLAFREREDY